MFFIFMITLEMVITKWTTRHNFNFWSLVLCTLLMWLFKSSSEFVWKSHLSHCEFSPRGIVIWSSDANLSKSLFGGSPLPLTKCQWNFSSFSKFYFLGFLLILTLAWGLELSAGFGSTASVILELLHLRLVVTLTLLNCKKREQLSPLSIPA